MNLVIQCYHTEVLQHFAAIFIFGWLRTLLDGGGGGGDWWEWFCGIYKPFWHVQSPIALIEMVIILSCPRLKTGFLALGFK